MLLHELAERNAKRIPDKEALVFHDLRLTYKDINDKAGRIAAGLIKLGVGKGDNVALLIGNKPEIILCAFACWKIGAAIIPMNFYYTDAELNYILQNSEATTIVAADKFLKYSYAQRLPDITSDCKHLERKIVIGELPSTDCVSFSDLLGGTIDEESQSNLNQLKASVTDDDLAFLIYTGGTTGQPKGVLVTHEARYEVDRSWSDVLNLQFEDRIVLPGPLFHLLPWHFVIAAHIKGATIVLMETFDAERVLDTIEKEKITFIPGVPTMFFYLADAPGISKYDFSSLKMGITGGAVFPEAKFIEVEAKLSGFRLLNYFGLTEAGGDVTTVRPDDRPEFALTTIGRPIPGFEVKIVDKERREVPIDEEGEIAVKARWLKGYYKNPEETKKAFDDQGWLYTGDLGAINKEGYIIYKGREKDMFVCGGNNIYPAEIEVVLQKHPKISDAVVLPIPHSTLGEVGRAYVIPKKGEKLTPEELLSFCKAEMASMKIPKEFIIRESLPLTPVGKVNKKPLKQEINEEFGL